LRGHVHIRALHSFPTRRSSDLLHTTKLLGEHRAKGHNTRMFINLSAASLADEALPGWIGVAINAAKLPKGSVVFQFHEDDASRIGRKRTRLNSSPVKISYAVFC